MRQVFAAGAPEPEGRGSYLHAQSPDSQRMSSLWSKGLYRSCRTEAKTAKYNIQIAVFGENVAAMMRVKEKR